MLLFCPKLNNHFQVYIWLLSKSEVIQVIRVTLSKLAGAFLTCPRKRLEEMHQIRCSPQLSVLQGNFTDSIETEDHGCSPVKPTITKQTTC